MGLTIITKKMVSEEISSIPLYNDPGLLLKIYEKLKPYFAYSPEYIIKDYINSNIIPNKEFTKKILSADKKEIPLYLDSTFMYYFNRKWRLMILRVSPTDFTENTIKGFEDREFGDVNSYLVPNDEIRTNQQKKLARKDGKNEPVVVIQQKDGKYELIEGWHRTMSILRLGDNGEDLKSWKRVKIRAFVGI